MRHRSGGGEPPDTKTVSANDGTKAEWQNRDEFFEEWTRKYIGGKMYFLDSAIP
jgi:hypothetical protein